MPQQFTTPLLLVLMVAAFYFLMIRPQQKRARAQRETLTSLGPGTRVLLANGFYATVVSVRDSAIEVELAPGVVSHVVKQAVVQVVSPEADPAVDQPLEDGPAEPVDPEDPVLEQDGPTTEPEDRAGGTSLSEPTSTVGDPEPGEPRAERTPRSDS